MRTTLNVGWNFGHKNKMLQKDTVHLDILFNVFQSLIALFFVNIRALAKSS